MYSLACLGEVQGDGVYAVAEARGRGTVVEDMAEMGVTAATGNFGAHHSEAAVDRFANIFLGDWSPETGPSGAGVELGVGVEQSRVAAHAAEDAFLLPVRIVVGVRAFGGGVTSNFEGIRSELLFPFGFRFHDPVHSDGGDLLADIGKFDDRDGIGSPADSTSAWSGRFRSVKRQARTTPDATEPTRKERRPRIAVGILSFSFRVNILDLMF